MKRILALFVLILPLLSFADQKKEDFVVFSTFFEGSGFGYIQLSDGLIWQVYSLKIRDQTWSEWWNSVEVPKPDECFLTGGGEWGEKTPVCLHVFDATQFDLNMEDLQNKNILRSCTHLIENKGWGKYLFARQVNFMKVVQTLKGHFYNVGYNAGHSAGYSSGYSSGYYVGSNQYR